MKKPLALCLTALLGLTLLTACRQNEPVDVPSKTPTAPTVNAEELYTPTHTATMTIADLGTIELELYGNLAPISVENFVSLAEDGFYDGLIFHRVISGFMIQGGDPKGTGTGGSDTNIVGEFADNGIANDLSHTRGVLSMARSQSYDSASSQFFIMHADYTGLDGSYAAFGKVTDGMDVVDAIAAMETGANDKPVTDVVIESIVIN